MASKREQYLGPYRLITTIATGPKTEVWEAAHDALRLRVAIKRLRPQVAGGYAKPPAREELAALRHEHAVGAGLVHPNVIKTIELGASRDQTYLVLELFPVPNMKQWILNGTEPLLPRAKEILMQATDALLYLHGEGWVHRDVKPDNFLISPEGEVKIIDLALARRVRTGLSRLLSGRGKAQGTPSYMSPEQIRGKPADPKADVYSLGCTVYEFLSGRKPYTGETPKELLSKHLSAVTPSLVTANRNITAEFSHLIRETLAKSPGDRPSLSDFRDMLTAIELFKTPPKPPESTTQT